MADRWNYLCDERLCQSGDCRGRPVEPVHRCPGLALHVGQVEAGACLRSFLFHAEGMLSGFIDLLEVLAAKQQHHDYQNEDEQAFHAQIVSGHDKAAAIQMDEATAWLDLFSKVLLTWRRRETKSTAPF